MDLDYNPKEMMNHDRMDGEMCMAWHPVFLTKNKWIDQYNEYTLYSVTIANYKGVIGSLTVINIIIEKCEADPNLDVCKLINF